MKRNRLIYALPLVCFMATAALADNYGEERRGAATGSRSGTSDSMSSDRGSMSRDTQSSGASKSTMADTAITAKVKAALLAERDLPSTQIKVETKNGVVQLSGFLNSQSEIDRAVSVARNIDDVKSVESNIQTK